MTKAGRDRRKALREGLRDRKALLAELRAVWLRSEKAKRDRGEPNYYPENAP